MAAKTKGKGTSLLVEISSVYTAIAGLISLDISGEKSENFNGRTLDGAAHSDMPLTGYVSNPEISAEFFYDSADVAQLHVLTTMRTPVIKNFKITDVAASPKSTIWAVTSIGWSEKYSPDDGVKASITLGTSGVPA